MLIKRGLATAALLVLAVTATPAGAQDLSRDEVLANYYEAVGGLEAWSEVETMQATGTATLGTQMTAPFTLYSKRPEKLRIEYEVRGMTGIQAFDGRTGWMLMPFAGVTEPREMPPAQAASLERDADFDGPLMGWKEDGHAVELVGRETVEGTETYRLEVTREDRAAQHYFLDAEDFLPLRITGTRQVRGTAMEYYTDLGDYREVEGLMIAHSIESGIVGGTDGQTITIESVELNVPVPDSLFTMPPASGGTP